LDTEKYEIPLFWPLVATAIMYILGVSAYWGMRDHSIAVSGLPTIIADINRGIISFRNADFAIPGIIVAIGASLGAPTARHALVWVGIGALWVIISPIICIEWTNIAGYAAFKPADGLLPPGATSLSEVRTNSILMFIALSLPLHGSSMWVKTALSGATTALVIHFLLGRLNGLPAPWQSNDDEESDGEWVYEIGGGIAIIALTIWFVFGALIWPNPLRNPNASADQVLTALRAPDKDGAQIKTAAGREYIKQVVNSIAKARDAALRESCSKSRRDFLLSLVNGYFEEIRYFEDWKPGTELSSASVTVRQRTETLLEQNFIGWDDLQMPAKIHLDRKKYESSVRTYPTSCKAIAS
jgi:hypothetical protein